MIVLQELGTEIVALSLMMKQSAQSAMLLRKDFSKHLNTQTENAGVSLVGMMTV